jgi:hypothetical protein
MCSLSLIPEFLNPEVETVTDYRVLTFKILIHFRIVRQVEGQRASTAG